MSFWKSLFGGLFGSSHKEQSVEDWVAQKSTVPPYAPDAVTAQQDAGLRVNEMWNPSPWKDAGSPPLAPETLSLVPIRTAMPSGYDEWLAKQKPRKRQPIKARKALKAVKAKKKAKRK